MNDNRTVKELRDEYEARMREKEVLEIDYHRNGVGGDGFFVALVRDPDLDNRVLVAIVPAWAVEQVRDLDVSMWNQVESPAGGLPCFVIDPEIASGPWTKPGTIAFGTNSWRGDNYFDLVVKAAQERG